MSGIDDPGLAAKKVAALLETLVAKGGLELRAEMIAGAAAVAGPVSRPGLKTPELKVELSGPDTPLLLARNGELLHAIEHVAAKVLRLEDDEHDRISFDAEGFKAERDRSLRALADGAIESVRRTGRPFSFSPMNSRERRMLHLLLAESGLPTASSGENPRRFVVLYPEGGEPVAAAPAVPAPVRARAIRNSFRPR